MLEAIKNFLGSTGVANFGANWWQYLIMYVIIIALFYLAIVKKFEPLLLLPIAFGMLLANLPGADLIHLDYFFDEYYMTQKMVDGTLQDAYLQSNIDQMLAGMESLKSTELFQNFDVEAFENIFKAIETNGDMVYTFDLSQLNGNEKMIDSVNFVANSAFGSLYENGAVHIPMTTMIKQVINHGGLVDILYLGVKLGIYPSLIFMGVGAMTDFSPLIANPKSLFMGAGAQLGVFVAFFAALFLGFSPMEAGSIGIIGGADGPTAILITKTLAPHLLGAIAIAAYSYMALIPIIQPPFMKLLTTKKERAIKMGNLRSVSKKERIIFPILVTAIVTLLVPSAAPLIGFLMLGNLFTVSGVTDRLSKTSQNELCNIITICLGVSVGATANAENFLKSETIYIIVLGLCAFIISTCGGLLVGKLMCKLSGGKINPLIGAAGVSAVPMAARVAQDVGRKEDPSNFLLMHAMGPNVAGVIGSAVAAGVFLSFLA